MEKWIQGIHHVALRPTQENYERTLDFYTQVLGLEIARTWGSEERPCCMLSVGDNSFLELLSGGPSDEKEPGAHDHLAFATEQPDVLVERVREAGYEITQEPTDIVIASEEPYPARIAFCIGPVNEIIEFFWVK